MGGKPSKNNAIPVRLLPPVPEYAAGESRNAVTVERNRSVEEDKDEDRTSLRWLLLTYETGSDFVSQMNWVDDSGRQRCMLYARTLNITWGEDPRYWRWFPLQVPSRNIRIHIAALVNVCWLNIHGKLEVSCLTPETMYEAAFVLMLNHTSYGWNVPVNLQLVYPGEKAQKRTENLKDQPRGEWIELIAGEFRASDGKLVEISLFEYESGAWKNGLVVRGIRVYPKT